MTKRLHSFLMNAARNLSAMYPGYFGTQTKHDYKTDFGWPEKLDFKKYHGMYSRNGMAKAAVHKTASKTWEDFPRLALASDPSSDLNPQEKAINDAIRRLKLWQKCAEADRRAMVGGYSALIVRYADGKSFDQPLGKLVGIKHIKEVIVAWSEQIVVSRWDTDNKSETYGQALMYQFNESEVHANRSVNNRVRSFEVHPDRVFVWSNDGTVFGQPLLEAGFNDLIDMEKIKGAGGEGFWKNAKAAPVLEVDKDASLREMASAMGVAEDGILDAMSKQVEDYSKGFDNLLMLQGIQAKPMNVQLNAPDPFFMVALQTFAASVEIPLKILVGTQSGERASTEDAREWSQTINARRVNVVLPLLGSMIDKWSETGVLTGDWQIIWSDLTKATISDKLELAIKMASINMKTDVQKRGRFVFTKQEIRQAVDYPAVPILGKIEELPDPKTSGADVRPDPNPENPQ